MPSLNLRASIAKVTGNTVSTAQYWKLVTTRCVPSGQSLNISSVVRDFAIFATTTTVPHLCSLLTITSHSHFTLSHSDTTDHTSMGTATTDSPSHPTCATMRSTVLPRATMSMRQMVWRSVPSHRSSIVSLAPRSAFSSQKASLSTGGDDGSQKAPPCKPGLGSVVAKPILSGLQLPRSGCKSHNQSHCDCMPDCGRYNGVNILGQSLVG